jgi:hypothetical protein
MPELRYFPPTPEAIARMAQIPGLRLTNIPVVGVDGPDSALGPEAAQAILHLHMTMIDEDKTRVFWDHIAATLTAASRAPGLIRYVAMSDGLSNDAVAWWRTLDQARAFAQTEVHRAAVSEMYREGFEYSHFAGLWQLVEPRNRQVCCDDCGAWTVLPADACRECGSDLTDVFRDETRS